MGHNQAYKANIPLTETAADVARVVKNKQSNKVLLTLILVKMHNHRFTIIFISLDLNKRIKEEKEIKGIVIIKCSHLVIQNHQSTNKKLISFETDYHSVDT